MTTSYNTVSSLPVRNKHNSTIIQILRIHYGCLDHFKPALLSSAGNTLETYCSCSSNSSPLHKTIDGGTMVKFCIQGEAIINIMGGSSQGGSKHKSKLVKA
jgi:hypothetical protein